MRESFGKCWHCGGVGEVHGPDCRQRRACVAAYDHRFPLEAFEALVRQFPLVMCGLPRCGVCKGTGREAA